MKTFKFNLEIKSIINTVSIFFISYMLVLNMKSSYLDINTIETLLVELFFIFRESEIDLYTRVLNVTSIIVIISIFSFLNLRKYVINYNKFILYRVESLKEINKYKYIKIFRHALYSTAIFIVAMIVMGNYFANSETLNTIFKFDISYKSIVIIINLFLIQILAMSLVCIIFNINNYTTIIYVLIIYSITMIIDRYTQSFSFIFNDNKLIVGSVILIVINILIYIFRDINKNVDY